MDVNLRAPEDEPWLSDGLVEADFSQPCHIFQTSTPVSELETSTPVSKSISDLKQACPVKECANKTFSNKSNLKRHWVNSHVKTRPMMKCAIGQCTYTAPSDGAFQQHVREFHPYSFRDRNDCERYCKRITIQNPKFVDPGATPLPQGLELPTVHAYWRHQGKETPQFPPQLPPQLPPQQAMTITNPNPTDIKVPTEKITNENVNPLPTITSITPVRVVTMEEVTPNAEIELIHQRATIPSVQSTRDYQPLQLIQENHVMRSDVPDVRKFNKDPLRLSNLPNRPIDLVARIVIDGEFSNQKEELKKASDEVDKMVENLRQRRDAIKMRIRNMESTEVTALRREVESLRGENETLRNRLKEYDSANRRINSTPVGTQLMRY